MCTNVITEPINTKSKHFLLNIRTFVGQSMETNGQYTHIVCNCVIMTDDVHHPSTSSTNTLCSHSAVTS